MKTSSSPDVTKSDFHIASPLPGRVPRSGRISADRCTVAPAAVATAYPPQGKFILRFISDGSRRVLESGMTSSEEPTRRGRGRPRSPGAEEKILHAALEEYTEHGWAGFTMDGVARRAGFGKSTLYL